MGNTKKARASESGRVFLSPYAAGQVSMKWTSQQTFEHDDRGHQNRNVVPEWTTQCVGRGGGDVGVTVPAAAETPIDLTEVVICAGPSGRPWLATKGLVPAGCPVKRTAA